VLEWRRRAGVECGHMTRKRIALTVFAVLLLLTYIPVGDYDDQAIVVTRDADGEWQYEGDDAFNLSLQLSKATTSTRQSTGTTSYQRSGAWRCERIWILNTSSSAITRAVGVAMQRDLLKQSTLNEVAYFGHDELPLKVRRPPDLYILLRLDEASSFVLPGFARFGADLNIVASRRPDLATSSLDDSEVPISIQASIECSSEAFGILTSGARDTVLAGAIVETIALGARLTWADEALPRQPSPDLDWIADAAVPPTDLPTFGKPEDSLHLYSQGAWLRHEETLWQVEVPGDGNEWMANFLWQLENKGWDTLDPRASSSEPSPRATATLGSRYLTISSDNEPKSPISSVTTSDPGDGTIPSPIGPLATSSPEISSTTVLVSHETRFTEHQILRLFELNPDAWSEMIPHLSNRERSLLLAELDGVTNPALQDLATRLAQD
jgi:hypothetical protein